MSDENKPVPTGPESFRALDQIPLTILSFLAVLALHTVIVQACWNYLLTERLGGITFFQALMFLVLCRTLFGGGSKR